MTRFCTCPGALSLVSNRGRKKIAEDSCKTCGGRFIVDGIGPISRSMVGTVGLEVTNSINPDLNWKTVTKGKRSKKAVARCIYRDVQMRKKSPKRVGDFSGSDLDKSGKTGNGLCFADKVPLKKRRHALRSPSPSPLPPSYGGESESPQLLTLSLHSEDFEHYLSDHNGSSGSYTNWLAGGHGNGVNVGVRDEIYDLPNGVLYNSDNFSGIALLAAAACINNKDDDAYNDKADAIEVSSAPQRSDDASTTTLPMTESIHCSEAGKQSKQVSKLENDECSFVVEGYGTASHSLDESKDSLAAKSSSLKVDRMHWDLNTLMDAWEQPDNDAGKAEGYSYLSAFTDGMPIVNLEKEGCAIKRVSRSNENDAESCLPLGQLEKVVEGSISKLEENELEEFCGNDVSGIEETGLSNLSRNSMEPLNFFSSDAKFSEHVLGSNESIDNSPEAESCHSSEVSGRYLDSKSDVMATTCEDSCRNAIGSSLLNSSKHNVAQRDASEMEKFVCENETQTAVPEGSRNTSELPGTKTLSLRDEMCMGTNGTLDVENSDSISQGNSLPSSKYESLTTSDNSIGGQPTGSGDAKGQDVEVLAANSLGFGTGEHLCSQEIVSKREDDHISGGEAEGISILQDLGQVFVSDDRHNSDVSQNGCGYTDFREKMAELEVGYDSPYEDGELRGSVLYSWEGNEYEDGEFDCVDYESDGRGGEDSNAGDVPNSKMMEADSEGTKKTSLLDIPARDAGSMKSSPARSSFRRNVEENAEKTDVEKRATNQGSGSTEELSTCVNAGRNDGSLRIRHTSDHMDILNVKGSKVGELESKTTRGKLLSWIEGPSSLDSTEREAANGRSRNIGCTYSRAGREGSPERIMSACRSDAYNRERKGGDSKYGHWGSRNRFQYSCRGPEGHGPSRQRKAIVNSVEKLGGVNSFDLKQSLNYSTRSDRECTPDRFATRYRYAVQERERNGRDNQVVYFDRTRYASSYRGPEGHGQGRPRSSISDTFDRFGGLNSSDRKQSINYSSESTQRPLDWRPSLERDDYHGGPRRIRGFSSNRSKGGSRTFFNGVGRGFREEYHQSVENDDASSGRGPDYLPYRERNIFPHSSRGVQASVPRRSSRSRSRTRSPCAWQPRRERNLGTRRFSRSPDFRSESRMERMRVPFQKPSFAADYGDSFMSPPRGRFSPTRNFRGGDERNFVDKHLRHRRSLISVFRQNQRLDSDGGLTGRLKSDDSFRPLMRPGRFPSGPGVGVGRDASWKPVVRVRDVMTDRD